MEESVFSDRIEEARRQILDLPADQQGPLLKLLEETCERQTQLKTGFAHIHHLLDDWRVRMKYLNFDLEATRRELAEYRRRFRELDGDHPQG